MVLAPSVANLVAVARPTPLAAPVMSALRPVSLRQDIACSSFYRMVSG